MKLSVTSWSFPQLTLREVGDVARAIGMDGVDLGLFYRSALDKNRLLRDPAGYGSELRASLPLSVANYYHLFGVDLSDRNLAAGVNQRNLTDLKAILLFAKAIGAPSVFVLPGVINPGQSRKSALAAAGESLKPMVAEALKAGIAMTVEPHVHGILESPDARLELIDRVPGLKITLDPAHFVALGFRQDEIEQLAPHTGHVHLRQATQGILQSKMEHGTINFPAFFAALRDAGYDGWLAIEYVHQAFMNTLTDDVLSETIKMRDCYQTWAGLPPNHQIERTI